MTPLKNINERLQEISDKDQMVQICIKNNIITGRIQKVEFDHILFKREKFEVNNSNYYVIQTYKIDYVRLID